MDQNNQSGQNYRQNQNNQQSQTVQQTQNVQQTQYPEQGQNNQQNQTPAAAAPVKAKSKSNKGLIIAMIILAVAILGVGGFLGVRWFLDNSNDNAVVEEKDSKEKKSEKDKEDKEENTEEETPEDVPEPEPAPARTLEELDESEISVIELYPDRTVAKRDLESFAAMIEERAAILGSNYKIEYDNSKITLTVEKALLGASPAEKSHTAELLISRGNIGFGVEEYISYYSPVKADLSGVEVVKLDKSDILSTFGSEMMEEKYDQLESIDGDVIYALEVDISSDGQENLDEMLESYTNPKLTVMHDYLEENTYDANNFFASVLFVDDRSMSSAYLISPGASSEKNAQVMKKILEQEQKDFGVVMDIQDEPIWETSGRKMGSNQVTSMTDGKLLIEWTPDDYTRSYLSEVEFSEFEDIIKNRMDTLGIDYMFGTSGFDDKTYCLRLASEDFAPDFCRLIFSDKEISIRSAFSDLFGIYNDAEIVEYDDGSYGLRFEAWYTKEELKEDNNCADNTRIYLVVNDVTIASANIDDAVNIEDGYSQIDFKDFLCFDNPVAGEDELNVLELICTICDDNYAFADGTLNFRVYGMGENEGISLGELDWKYSSLSAEDERIFSILAGECYGADKLVDKRNMLVITLDLPINDDLPENFLNEVERLYNLCSFDSGAYNEIQFVIKDEKRESPANEFRVTVTKSTIYETMRISEDVSGPKFWDYWYDTYTLMEESPFYNTRGWY